MPKSCLPTSVWPVAQKTAPSQRKKRYLPASSAHPAKMLPAIARSAIEAYTSPGDIVCDPMCGIGTTLVEGIHLCRDAVGIEYEPRWAEIALANLAHARANGATGKGEVLVGDGRHVSTTVDPALRGLVSLVLTSPPYGPSLHGHVHTVAGGGVHKFNNTYSSDPANLGAVGLDELLQAVLEILVGCRRILQPGGIVAMTVRPWRENGTLIDLPGLIGNLADAAGLDLFERNVALLAGLRSGRLVPRASFFAMEHARKSHRRGTVPRLVIAHEDVLVFRKSPKYVGSGLLKDSQKEPKCSPEPASTGTFGTPYLEYSNSGDVALAHPRRPVKVSTESPRACSSKPRLDIAGSVEASSERHDDCPRSSRWRCSRAKPAHRSMHAHGERAQLSTGDEVGACGG